MMTALVKISATVALVTVVAGCASQRKIVPVAEICPTMPIDIIAESKRPVRIVSNDAFRVAGSLKLQIKEKNQKLKRAVELYAACRSM